jgi:small GTP-binding protein
MARSYDHLFKLMIIGDSGVGKTSILSRYVDSTFNTTFISTIGIDFKIKTIVLDNKTIKLQVWDTAGQERFKSITSAYYRGAMGVLLVYDITNKKSYDNIRVWIQHIRDYSYDNNVKIIIIGNKCDLENARIISKKEGSELATEHGALFIEVSAMDGVRISDAFITIAKEIMKCIPTKPSNIVTISPVNDVKLSLIPKKKSSCLLL